MFTPKQINDHDAAVAVLDPLRADQALARLPRANASADITWLARTATELLARAAEIHTPLRAQAGLRDLGMVLASLIRHDPATELVHRAEQTLVRLGAIAQEVPRDTVYSYGPRNPAGRRRRVFTGAEEEHLFIDSVTRGTNELNCAVALCIDLVASAKNNDPETTIKAAEGLQSHLNEFASCLVTVTRGLTPGFFTNQLRPYFPPMDIGDRRYFAPGGAQMPLLVVDTLLLWGVADGSLGQWHEYYILDNVPYLPLVHRQIITTAMKQEGLTAYLNTHSEQSSVRACAAVRPVVNSLMRFRYPHHRLARNNFSIRSDTALGSGGYNLNALDRLLEITENATALLRKQSID